jgi:mannose-6-phosphate isomerase-like protein (cupin superfamily)
MANPEQTPGLPRRSAQDGWAVSLAEALQAPIPEGQRSALIMDHGTMTLRFYAPQGVDRQTPHDQDEVYIVTAGSGWFVNGERRDRFAPGAALFVPAGVDHRFEDFSDDFATWVIFYGPKGGEGAA